MSANPVAGLLRLAEVLLLGGILAFAGCARRQTTVTTYTLEPQTGRSWVGVSVDDVLARWGEPSEKTPDSEGGTILTYRSKSNVWVSSGYEEPGGKRTRNDPGSGYPDMAVQPADRELPRAPVAVFYISPKGVVYRYTIRSDVLTGGKAPEPPLPIPETPPEQTE